MAKNQETGLIPLVGVTSELVADIDAFTHFGFPASRINKCYSDPYMDHPECNPGVDLPPDDPKRRRCVLNHICLIHKAEQRCPGIDASEARTLPYVELRDLVDDYEADIAADAAESKTAKRKKAKAVKKVEREEQQQEAAEKAPPPPPPTPTTTTFEGDWLVPDWLDGFEPTPLPPDMPEWFAAQEEGSIPHFLISAFLRAGADGIPNSKLVELVQNRFAGKGKALVTEVVFQARTAQKREPGTALRLLKVAKSHYALTMGDG